MDFKTYFRTSADHRCPSHSHDRVSTRAPAVQLKRTHRCRLASEASRAVSLNPLVLHRRSPKDKLQELDLLPDMEAWVELRRNHRIRLRCQASVVAILKPRNHLSQDRRVHKHHRLVPSNNHRWSTKPKTPWKIFVRLSLASLATCRI